MLRCHERNTPSQLFPRKGLQGMRRLTVFIFMLAATAAMAQTNTSSSAQSTPAAPAKASPATKVSKSGEKSASDAAIPGTKPVLTLQGVCSDAALGSQSSDPKSCSMVVTKQDFEEFLESLRATGQRVPVDVPPSVRRSIAQTYVEMLPFEEAAKKLDLDKSTSFQAAMKGVRISLLSRLYRYHIEQEARKSPPEEIEAYYKKNLANYEELTLSHIVLPANNPMNLKDEAFHKKAEELINELRERFVKGEDADKLEKEGIERLGQKSPPPTELVPARRGQYGKDLEEKLFALQPGEVTPVVKLPSVNGAYKLISRRTIPLEEATSEIVAILAADKVEKETKELTESVHADYDTAYFGPNPPQSAAAPKKAAPAK